MRFAAFMTMAALLAAPVRAQVFSSDFDSDPVSEGWPLYQQYCDPQVWNDGGAYYQNVDFEACGPPPGGGQDEYFEDIQEYNEAQTWFYELRVATTGNRSEIPGNAPTVLAAGNFFGENYKVNVARDQVKFFRDTSIPNIFVDVEPGMFHTVRLELNNVGTPTFKWFLDGQLIDEGLAEGVFPSDNATITWRGKAWYLPAENAWDYIRYGVIPVDASGDFDSDGHIDLRDWRYFVECVERTGITPGDPGCQWADLDFDTDVDMRDFGGFQRVFGG